MHEIDLRPDLATLYGNLHKSCIQRKIKRAEREQLRYECGSELLLRDFYSLFVLTRKRHGLPPPPLLWFKSVVKYLGNRAKIHVVYKEHRPAASILTLWFRNSVVYKYGCSDDKVSNLGGTPFLFWKLIQEAKQSGMEKIDLGRSDLDQPGLCEFKEHLGGSRSKLKYYSFPAQAKARKSPSGSRMLRSGLTSMPGGVLQLVGRVLYKHFA
jgi:lipid II:glycine glycyltransferase (peptidoglycan interpeptide bridge formation enzyme)